MSDPFMPADAELHMHCLDCGDALTSQYRRALGYCRACSEATWPREQPERRDPSEDEPRRV